MVVLANPGSSVRVQKPINYPTSRRLRTWTGVSAVTIHHLAAACRAKLLVPSAVTLLLDPKLQPVNLSNLTSYTIIC